MSSWQVDTDPYPISQPENYLSFILIYGQGLFHKIVKDKAINNIFGSICVTKLFDHFKDTEMFSQSENHKIGLKHCLIFAFKLLKIFYVLKAFLSKLILRLGNPHALAIFTTQRDEK